MEAKLSLTLHQLFNSQYFHRTWTIPEMAFSSRAVVLWANRALPCPTFWGAGQAYFEKASPAVLSTAHGFHIHGMAYDLISLANITRHEPVRGRVPNRVPLDGASAEGDRRAR